MNITFFPSDLRRISKLTEKFDQPIISVNTHQMCDCCDEKMQLAINFEGTAVVSMFYFEISECLDEIEADEEAMKIANKEEI